MNFKSSIKLQLQRNLEDLKPGKKQFPHRNLHYATSIGSEQKSLPNSEYYTRHSSVNLYKVHEPSHMSVKAQIESLKRQLEEKSSEIFRLSSEMKQKSEASIKHREPKIVRITHQSVNPQKFRSISEQKRRFLNGQSLLTNNKYEVSVTLFEQSKKIAENRTVTENPYMGHSNLKIVKSSVQDRIQSIAPTVYFTKRAPKTFANDPITGLPRGRSFSPFREIAMSVSRSKESIRPFY